MLTLKNQIDKNIWFWRDLPTMAELTGADPILLDVQADPPNPGGYPIGGQTLFPLNNTYRRDASIAYVQRFPTFSKLGTTAHICFRGPF